jgi:hypothetical protein
MIYWLRSARADLKLSPPLSPPARFFQIKIKEALAPQAQVQKASDLPPKADMCGATRDVRFGPEADIRARLFDHLVGAPEYCGRHSEAERLRRF